jgi:thiosulfate dehydrogenase (quinone) large subunit
MAVKNESTTGPREVTGPSADETISLGEAARPLVGKVINARAAGVVSASFAPWRLKGIGILRIIFGVVWGIDAWFKWQPDFINNFSSYLTGAQDGQPAFVKGWINFWINIVAVDPHVFAHGVAVAETLIALALLFGVLSNLTNIAGILLTVVIWTTAEGFGGPYVPGSADIGSAIIYSLVFVGLFLSSAGLYLGFDRWVTPRLGRFGFLASGPFIRPHFIRKLGHKENVAV